MHTGYCGVECKMGDPSSTLLCDILNVPSPRSSGTELMKSQLKPVPFCMTVHQLFLVSPEGGERVQTSVILQYNETTKAQLNLTSTPRNSVTGSPLVS